MKGAAQAYKGVAVEDLPNFGVLYGPNTNLSHNSLILVIEAQALYISAMVREVRNAHAKGKTLALTVGRGAVWDYSREIQNRQYSMTVQRFRLTDGRAYLLSSIIGLQRTSFADPACSSWWKRDDGLIINNW